MNALSNLEWINRFGIYLKRRFPERSTVIHKRLALHLAQPPEYLHATFSVSRNADRK